MSTGAPARRHYQQQLARRLQVAGNMAITLSIIGPAASVFAIGPVALRQQGSGAFLAFLVAAVLSACLAVGWAELGALYPTAGGLYGIVARVFGRWAGFLALVLQLALFVIVPSAFTLAAGEYLTALWPAVSP
jgi:amino acid transporter